MGELLRVLWLMFRWCLAGALTVAGFGIQLLLPLADYVVRVSISMMALFIIAALFIKPMVVLEYGAMIIGSLVFYALAAEGCLRLARVIRPTPEEWAGGAKSRAMAVPEGALPSRPEQPVTLDLVDGEWK